MSDDLPAATRARHPDLTPEAEGKQLAALLTRVGIAAWSFIGILVSLWVVLEVLSRFRILLAPVVLATALIYVLNPIVTRLHNHGLHRILGSFAAFGLLLGGLVLLGFIVAPSITDQASELSSDFPQIYEDSAAEIEGIIHDLGFGSADLWSYEELQERLEDPEVRDRFFSAALDRLGQITSGLLEAILVFLVAPVVAFYVLIDLPRVREQTVSLLPEAHRPEVIHVSRQLGTAVGGFLRGQVIVALIVGLLTSFGFWLIDLRFWLIIGMIAGFLNIIPFVGPWVGGTLGVLVGLVTADVSTAVAAAIVALVVQQIDNNFISPTVLRATVSLHPAVVLLVLILGGGIGGLWGVLLAVPVTAALKIIAGHLWRTRVLEQSWEEARDALIAETPTPEPLLSRLRRLSRLPGKRGSGDDGDGEPDDDEASLGE
ncbi:MAG: AI-2E family transporter [Acidimicrobiia bacterium]|nr:AI-2E family transporter [Acidimicrobiia bacterium]